MEANTQEVSVQSEAQQSPQPPAAPASNRMGVLPEGKLLWSMGVPLSLSMLIQALYNIVDSIFVSYIGENALTAVSLAYPMNMRRGWIRWR